MRLSTAVLLLLAVAIPFSLSADQQASIITDTSVAGVWSYRLTNLENPATSTNNIYVFDLALGGTGVPFFDVTVTPPNWDFLTDNSTYVNWVSSDLPFDLAPGGSLDFALSSPGSTSTPGTANLQFWDHTGGEGVPGGSTTLAVPIPSQLAPVPEPASIWLVSPFLLALPYLRKRRK